MGITDRLKGNVGGKPNIMSRPHISNKIAFLIAIVGGLIAAIFAMLIPIYMLESLTGASGLSEIIPATAAPLGSSARILFVIFTAILAASFLLVLLLSVRKPPVEESIYPDDHYVNEMARDRNRMSLSEDDSKLAERIYQEDQQNFQTSQQYHDDGSSAPESNETANKNKFPAAAGGALAAASAGFVTVGSALKSKINKLPFMGGDDSIKSFDDLPKLRGADKHPDAPARRPLSAHEDLGERILDKEDDSESVSAQAASDSPAQTIKSNLSNIEDNPDDNHQNNAQQLMRNIDQGDRVDQDDRPATRIMEEPADAQTIREAAFKSANDLTSDDKAAQDQVLSAAADNMQGSKSRDALAHQHSSDVKHSDKDDMTEKSASVGDELPTINHLMDRLENIVERRAQKMETQKIAADANSIMDEKTIETPLETPKQNYAKTNERSTDSADVIEPAPSKRAAKSEHQEKPSDLDSAMNNQSMRKISKEANLTGAQQAETNGEQVGVTKNQKIEMDNALQSALNTLHKMTERSA